MAAALPASPVGAAALLPSTPTDIAAAVGECWQAVSATGVDRTRLNDGGWILNAATADSKESPLDAFEKPGANHRILLVHEHTPKPLCTVIARLSSRSDAGTTLEAIQSNLKSLGANAPASRSGDGIAFLSLPRFAQVDQTDAAGGTEQQPSLRIVVGYEVTEQK